jgi:uncharacterized protein with HEPN domain
MGYSTVETDLRDMRAAALEARELCAGCKAEDLEGDRVKALALERLLQRVADAAGRVPAQGRKEHPGMPWAKLDELGRTVATTHAHLDPRALWGIVTREAPLLLEALHGALPTREYD